MKTGNTNNILIDNTDLVSEIKLLKKKKNVTILAHFYQLPEVQDIADFVGDSLALAKKALIVDSHNILLAGVKFMAETAKILATDKRVFLPDLNAGCSLADSCNIIDLQKFIDQNPNYKIVSYVNSSAEVKALSYICCTSSNAVKVVKSLGEENVMFVPDQNLGNYVKSIIEKENMIVWPGACHVHKKFSLEKLLKLKSENKSALVIAHPECDKVILLNSDFIGSTAELINFVQQSKSDIFIIGTEPGVIHQMRIKAGNKKYIPIPPDDSDCACNECNFMKMINLNNIYLTLKNEKPEIILENSLIEKAYLPIKRMIDLS